MNTTRSADGTTIAYDRSGHGAPLILIGGAFCDRHARASGTPLAARLAPRFDVIAYDRRGRGESTNTPPWSVERELQDLAALMDVLGGRASLYGISSGGLLALEAAAIGLPVTRLAMYEAPWILDDQRRPSEALARELDAACAEGRRGDAVELFLTRVVGMPAAAVAGMRRAPMWPGLESLAHTLCYDVRITAAAPMLAARAASLRVPTWVLDGGASPALLREGAAALVAAIPGATRRTIEGQTHDVDAALLADVLCEVLG